MPDAPIERLERRLHDCRSSTMLEEIQVEFVDGTTLPLVFKDMGHDSVTEEARGVKPAFVRNPMRAISVYRDILTLCDLGTARCWATLADPDRQRYWLFLEDVNGEELYQFGELEVWQYVAHYLAQLHRKFESVTGRLQKTTLGTLLEFNPAYYRCWIDRALEFAEHKRPADRVRQLRHLHDRYDRVIERVEQLPHGLIHGECYASNVLVDLGRPEGRVCPVDWEMAAIGPHLIDLAALIVGHWRAGQSEAIASAYLEEINRGATSYASENDFFSGLKYCRLIMAVQWLGWSDTWQPPKQHTFDWLAEALQLAEELAI